jgi:hypothetical protein
MADFSKQCTTLSTLDEIPTDDHEVGLGAVDLGQNTVEVRGDFSALLTEMKIRQVRHDQALVRRRLAHPN